MEKRFDKNSSNNKGKKILGIVIVLLLLFTIYYVFFFYKKCSDKDCFDLSLARCEKAAYTNYGADTSWYYKIQGKDLTWGFSESGINRIIPKITNKECIIYVKNIGMKNAENSAKLNNKDMLCYLPYQVVMAPEGNIDYCHGILKEGMQDIIIQNMNLYIIQNIGQIKGSELNTI